MNKALAKGFGIGILVIIISVLCMYLGLAFYYRDGFSYNTWINGVYCTGKTLDEVNEELQEEFSYPGLTIIDSDGKSYMISAQEVSLLMDYIPGLKAFYEKQSPLLQEHLTAFRENWIWRLQDAMKIFPLRSRCRRILHCMKRYVLFRNAALCM